MKYLSLLIVFLYAFSASAETLSGRVSLIRDNVAYIKTNDGKKIPVILNEQTYYRKKVYPRKGKGKIEFYQPLIGKGDTVTLTYDINSKNDKTGTIEASDVLIISD